MILRDRHQIRCNYLRIDLYTHLNTPLYVLEPTLYEV